MEQEKDYYAEFLTLEIEREVSGILKEDSVKKVVNRIHAVSNIIFKESRRGDATNILFRGNLAWLVYEEIKRNKNYMTSLRKYNIESSRDPSLNYIELIREGDFFYLEESFNEKNEKILTLKSSREKQPDIIKRINLVEKQ